MTNVWINNLCSENIDISYMLLFIVLLC